MLVVDVVTGGVGVVEDVGAHDSDTAWAPAGRPGIEPSGVPAGTLTGSVIVCPVISATVTVQESADATGISAIACMASAVATVASATVSFRLLNTLRYLLPPRGVRNCAAPQPRGGAKRTLPAGVEVCNDEPSVAKSSIDRQRITAPYEDTGSEPSLPNTASAAATLYPRDWQPTPVSTGDRAQRFPTCIPKAQLYV